MAKTSKLKATKVSKAQKKAESSSESSSSSSESSSESSSSSSESESESEAEKKADPKKESESDSDSESDKSDSESDKSDSEDEKPAKKAGSDKADSDKSDSESDAKKSDSDSSDSESEDEEKKESESEKESESDSDSKKRSASEESEESEAKKAKTEPTTVFVGRLSWNVDDDWLKREFEHIGDVISARVIVDRQNNNRSKGYGYVDFETKEAAEKAIKELQGHEIDGRPINVDLSTGRAQTPNRNERARQYGDVTSAASDTLFVGNLSFNTDRDSLSNAFGEFGSIVSCRIPTHPETQQPKGFGYVQFASVDEAKAAFDGFSGQSLDGRTLRLDFSQPRDNNQNRRGGFGGRGGRGGRGGFRSNNASPSPRNEFKGTKKTFD